MNLNCYDIGSSQNICLNSLFVLLCGRIDLFFAKLYVSRGLYWLYKMQCKKLSFKIYAYVPMLCTKFDMNYTAIVLLCAIINLFCAKNYFAYTLCQLKSMVKSCFSQLLFIKQSYEFGSRRWQSPLQYFLIFHIIYQIGYDLFYKCVNMCQNEPILCKKNYIVLTLCLINKNHGLFS